jgi:ankyrin repeat protein
MLAAYHEHLDVLACLLERGADTNKADNEGRTPLLVAAAMGQLAVVSCLLKVGADVDKRDNEGRTPLFVGAITGRLPVVRYLLKHGANINQACNDGGTPLMIAAAHKHAEVVTWLIKAGADTQSSMVLASGHAATAADYSREGGASAAQTAYLESKTHCSNTSCSGAGVSTRCKQARYCRESCQLAHWKAHKAECKR